MKVKTLVKQLLKLDQNADICSFMSIASISPPSLGKKLFVYEELSNGRKCWQSKGLSDRRPKTGKQSARRIKEKTVYTI